jgi:hypothetical protein
VFFDAVFRASCDDVAVNFNYGAVCGGEMKNSRVLNDYCILV